MDFTVAFNVGGVVLPEPVRRLVNVGIRGRIGDERRRLHVDLPPAGRRVGDVEAGPQPPGERWHDAENRWLAAPLAGFERRHYVVAVDCQRADLSRIGRLVAHASGRCRSSSPPQSGQTAR